MRTFSNVVTGLVAFLHIYFLVLEMFLWRTEKVRKAFGFSQEFADQSAVLAKNQGLYNGFLAAGLIWGLFAIPALFSFQIKFFFLLCVFIAGVFGAITANIRILFIQALPALAGLILLFI